MQGSRVPKFVSTLWTIWRSRNDQQLFRQQRPTPQSIRLSLQDDDNQHATFINPRFDPSRNPRGPNFPPGFHDAHIGRAQMGESPLLIQIDASWDKLRTSCGIAWVTDSTTYTINRKQGWFCYASSALLVECIACLKAITWARNSGYMHITVITATSFNC